MSVEAIAASELKSESMLHRVLNRIERVGNLVPNPAILFVGLAAFVAPIFVPMMMILSYSPEMTQATYRVGDSVINIVSPLMAYFPLIVAFAQKYDPKAGIGTLMALMMPHSIAFFVGWTLFLIGWFYFGLPLGPGAEIVYEMPHAAK